MTTSTVRIRTVLALSFAMLLVVAGCGTSGGEDAEDTTAATEAEPTTTTGDVGDDDADERSITYEVGQCFEPDGDGATSEALVDCDQPHRYEVAGIIDAPFDTIPDDADDQLKVACAEAVQTYTGGEGPGDGIKVTNLTLSGDAGDEVVDTGDELVVCLAEAPTGLQLTGTVAGGVADAIEPYVAVSSLEVGDCFALYDEFFYVVTPVACSDTDALVNLGTFAVEGDDYPGEDELKAQRDERCPQLAEELDLSNAADASGTAPSADDWLVGVRVVTCDVPVPTR